MGNKHNKDSTILKSIEHVITLSSTITRCFSISGFASLLSIGVTSSEIGLTIFSITGGIKKYKLRIKEKRKTMINHDKIVVLEKLN